MEIVRGIADTLITLDRHTEQICIRHEDCVIVQKVTQDKLGRVYITLRED